MAATIDSLAASARSALDSAYAENPEGDIETMKSAILAATIPESDDKASWLELASLTPDELIIENTDVYAEIYANGAAIVQAALDDEGNILQG